MKAQHKARGLPAGRKGRQIKLLLVGQDEQFKGNVARRIFNIQRSWIAGRTASLLGALMRLQSGAIDIVLLSHKFRDEELALFAADARRNGFDGLILRVTSMYTSGANFSGASLHAGFPAKALFENPLHSSQSILGARRQDDRWNAAISFTARQRDVLARVSQGWTNRQISRELQCSEGGVKATLQDLFKKLGVRKRSQIVRIVLEKRLLEAARSAPGGGASALTHPLLTAADIKGKRPVHVGDFVIDLAMHRVWVRGVEIHLTPSEFELLAIFAAHPGELLRGSSLCGMFWRNPTSKGDTLRVLIAALRAKIEVSKPPRYVVTEHNLGYRFFPSPSRSIAGEDDTPRAAGRA